MAGFALQWARWIGRGLIIGTLCLLSGGLVWGQEYRSLSQDTLDLQTALQMAIDNNPTIQQSLSNVELADLKVEAAYNALNPTLGVSFSELYVNQLRRSYNERDLEATLTIPIYNFGQVYWSARTAKLARNQAGEDLRTAIQNMIQQVATNFVEAQLNIQLVEISDLRVKDRQAYLDQASDLLEAGEIAEFETIQAESNVLAAQEQLYTSKQDSAVSLATLLVDLGVRPDAQVKLSALPALEEPPESVDEGLTRALALRPEVVSLRWQVESQLAAAKANRRQNAPQLSVYTDYDRVNEGSNFDPTWEAGLQLTWQLFDGGVAKNAARQSKVQADILQGQLGQEERQVSLDVISAYLQLQQLWPQIDISKRALDKAQETLNIAQLRFKAGLSNGVELLNAQDGLTNARTAVAQAEANYRLGLINWRRATSADYPIELPEDWRDTWKILQPGTTTPPVQTSVGPKESVKP